ncbi:MAG: hypothetical protein KatS3mg068_2652 [Candidatus Sericytochromatia bacterium]|nr:MAG: hypothetical protein KatS3mg068_2652 [Candidatus Sericytochromatia bacterium]GIX42090.1 MAG: hypothetical protein KatS3mg129_1823 [Leptospiraceae bacterium]
MKDFIASYELSSALLGLNPSIEKDIKLIEQGCSATLLMTQSPRSLRTIDSLQNIDENVLRILQNRNVLISYEFLEFENNQLKKKMTLIRPNSLKIEDAEKIKKICDEYSLLSFIKYLYYKENKIKEDYKKWGNQILENINYSSEINRSTILEMILRFESYSIESLLDIYDLNKRIIHYILQQLSNSSKEIYHYFSTNKEMTEEIKQFLLNRNNNPVLIALREDYHLLYPDQNKIITIDEEGNIEIIKTELEYLKDAAREICLRLAKFLSPEENWEQANIDNIFELFSKHPSLQSEETWPGLSNFIYTIENLFRICDSINNFRKEILVEKYIEEFLKNLNMNFEPFYISLEHFTIPENLSKYLKKEKKETIYKKFIEKLRINNEIIVYKSKLHLNEDGYYLIYKYNIPKAFISNKNRRSFIHLMLKNSGYPSGIYDFIIEQNTNDLPKILKEEQLELVKAIKEWEKEQEKKNRKSIFQIILDWLLKLFGWSTDSLTIFSNDKLKEQKQEQYGYKKKKNQFRENIPEYRLKKIPEKIEKAISFIDRQYNGLIWVDELAYVMDYKDIERLNSLLYYDKEQRFIEVKPLYSIKPLFIKKENLNNKEWLESTINTLKNSAKLPHQIALLEFLENYKKVNINEK